jgi:excisionase family DNA binding protein
MPRQSDEWIDPTEAAVEYDVSPSSIYRLMKRGELPYESPGRGRRIKRSVLEDVLARRRSRDDVADMDAAVERCLRSLPRTPTQASLLRVARILREEVGT